MAGFSIDLHRGLSWYPRLVSALAGANCEGTEHSGLAFYCVVGAVAVIVLEHSSLRVWRFVRPAGPRGLTDLSFARPAKSHARRIPASKRSQSSLGGLLLQ